MIADIVQQVRIPFIQKGGDSSSLSIRSINWRTAKVLLIQFHYLKDKMPAGILKIYGLYKSELVGVAVFTNTRCREWDKKGKVWELARFCLIDEMPKNSESQFLSKLYPLLRKQIDFIIAYSDPEAGHLGTIYKASGFKFIIKRTDRNDTFYIDNKRISARTIFDQFGTSSILKLKEKLGYHFSNRKRLGKLLFVKELKRNKIW